MGSRLIGVGLALVAIALIIVAAITPSWWTGPVAGSAQRSAQIGLLLAKGCTQPGEARATAGSAAAVAASATANAAPTCRDIAPDLAALDKRFVQVGQVAGGALAAVVVMLLLYAAFTWRQTTRRGVSLALLATTLVAAAACATFALTKPAQVAVPLAHGAMLAAVGCSVALVLGIVGMLAQTTSVTTSQRPAAMVGFGHPAPVLAPAVPPAFAPPQATPSTAPAVAPPQAASTAVVPSVPPSVVHALQPQPAAHADPPPYVGPPPHAGAGLGASVPVPPYVVPGSPAPSIAGLVPTARAAEPTAPPPFGLPAQIPLGAPPPLPGMTQGTAYEMPLLVPPPQRAEPTPIPARAAAASVPPTNSANVGAVGTRKPAAPTAPPPFGFMPNAHAAPSGPPLHPGARPPAPPAGLAWDSLEVKSGPGISSGAGGPVGRTIQRDATAELEADAVSEVTQLPSPPTNEEPQAGPRDAFRPAAIAASTTTSSDDLAIRRELLPPEAAPAPSAPRRERPDGTPTPRAGRNNDDADPRDALEIRASSKRSDDSAVKGDEVGADRPRRSFGATSRALRSQPTPTSAPDGAVTAPPAASGGLPNPGEPASTTPAEASAATPPLPPHAEASAASPPLPPHAEASAASPPPAFAAPPPGREAAPEAAAPTPQPAPPAPQPAPQQAPQRIGPLPAAPTPALALHADAPRPQRSSRADALSARLLGPQANRQRGPQASAAPPVNETKLADAPPPQRASADDHESATRSTANPAHGNALADQRAQQLPTPLALPVVAAAQPPSLAKDDVTAFEEEPTAATEPIATAASPAARPSATRAPRPTAAERGNRVAATMLGAAPDGRTVASPPVANSTQDPQPQGEPAPGKATLSQASDHHRRAAAPSVPPKPGPTATISTPVVPAPALGGLPHFTLPPKKPPQGNQGASSSATPSPFAAPTMEKSIAAHGTASAASVTASSTAAPRAPETATDSANVAPAATIAPAHAAESHPVASTTPQQRADAATEPPPTVSATKPVRAAPGNTLAPTPTPVEHKHAQTTINAGTSATVAPLAPPAPPQMAAQVAAPIAAPIAAQVATPIAAPSIDSAGNRPAEAATTAQGAATPPPRSPAPPSISPAIAPTTPAQREPARPTMPPMGKSIGAIGVPKISVPAVIKPARAVAATAHDFATDLQISPGATIPSRGAAAALQQASGRTERAADAFAANEATNPSGVVASESGASGPAAPASNTVAATSVPAAPANRAASHEPPGSEPPGSASSARPPSSPLGKPSPACPECMAPMTYVDDHQRYLCKTCKTYY